MERPIIEIDEERCNGCGQCILDCAEGALAIVNGKAKLVGEIYCDGLGACLNCPQGALSLRTRQAAPFDEAAVQARLKDLAMTAAPKVKNSLAAHFAKSAPLEIMPKAAPAFRADLGQWPIQMELMPLKADWYAGKEILLAAQCSGFALPLRDIYVPAKHALMIACPKLASKTGIEECLAAILAENDFAGITILRMSVPCCSLDAVAREAVAKVGKDIPLRAEVVKL